MKHFAVFVCACLLAACTAGKQFAPPLISSTNEPDFHGFWEYLQKELAIDPSASASVIDLNIKFQKEGDLSYCRLRILATGGGISKQMVYEVIGTDRHWSWSKTGMSRRPNTALPTPDATTLFENLDSLRLGQGNVGNIQLLRVQNPSETLDLRIVEGGAVREKRTADLAELRSKPFNTLLVDGVYYVLKDL